MKVGLYADPHFSLSSSILLGSSGSLDGRLSSLIKSFEWMYEVFRRNSVEFIVCLGDLTNSTTLSAEEITALSKAISYNKDIVEYIILGNHERMDEQGNISSLEFIPHLDNRYLVKEIETLTIDNLKITMIPYKKNYLESDLKDIDSDVIFSHIDILNSNIGYRTLDVGIDDKFLKTISKLTINGHIHTGSYVNDSVINLGCMSGTGFNATEGFWHPSIAILDTKDLKLNLIPNPYAIRYLRLDLDNLHDIHINLSKLESNISYVIRLTIPYDIRDSARVMLNKYPNIISSRIIVKGITNNNNNQVNIENKVTIDKVSNLSDSFKLLKVYYKSLENLPFNLEINKVINVINKVEGN